MTRESTSDRTPNAQSLTELLAAGGIVLHEAADARRELDPTRIPKYAALADPVGAERLGREIANLARERTPNLIAVWEDAEDAVLAHVVSRELGTTAVRMWNADGLVACSGALPNDVRALVVTDVVRDFSSIRAIRSYVERHGGVVVAVAALLPGSQDAEESDVITVVGKPRLKREASQ